MDTALAILTTLRSMFPDNVNAAAFPQAFDVAIGNAWVKDMILGGSSPAQIKSAYAAGLEGFKAVREVNLLYGVSNAGVTVNQRSYIELPVEFYMWLDGVNLEAVNAVEIVFTVCNNLHFAPGGLVPNLGFSPIALENAVGGIVWQRLPGAAGWRGTLRLGLAGKTVDIDGLTDIAKLSFQANGLGSSTLVIESFLVVSHRNGQAVEIDIKISEGRAVAWAYSIHDINRDGRVSMADLSIALLAIGWNSTIPGWNEYRVSYDSKGAVITPAMIDVNRDGTVDMLDLIEILRHFD